MLRISQDSCGHLVKNTDMFVMKTSTFFKRSYYLIALYSHTVSNYFECNIDVYSLLIRIKLSR